MEIAPAIFWGRVIQVMIRKGWNPPAPNDVQAHAILDDIEKIKEERKGIAFSTGEESFGSTLELGEIEHEVLSMLAQGMTIPEIARRRRRSPETVKSQVFNAREKLGAKNTAHAVALAIRAGLI